MNGKKIERESFKTKDKLKLNKLYYSYSYSHEQDCLFFYPEEKKDKNINTDRNYFGNEINLNFLWKSWFENINKYLPKMGKLVIVSGQIDKIGLVQPETLPYRLQFQKDCQEVFKDRLLTAPSFSHSVFSFLIELTKRYRKNVILIANTFCLICGENGISTMHYTVDSLIGDYAHRLDIQDLFDGESELKQIVNDMLFDYLRGDEKDYETTRQNQSVVISNDLIAGYYNDVLKYFVSSVQHHANGMPFHVIDVTSKDNRLTKSFFHLLDTSPYKSVITKYPDFIEDSLVYSYLVTEKNKGLDIKKALLLYEVGKENIPSYSPDSYLVNYSDGLYIYLLEYFMGEKSSKALLGEYIKKINFNA